MLVFFWFVRSSLFLLLLASIALMAATVPIGRRTLIGHTDAIASTRAARDLGEDLSSSWTAVAGWLYDNTWGHFDDDAEDEVMPKTSKR